MKVTVYLNKGCYEWDEKPILTGTSVNWSNFGLYAGGVNEFDIDWYDTIQFKFTFISDSIYENKDGWIIDNLYVDDWGDSSVDDKFGNNFASNVFPNPSNDLITLEFDNILGYNYQIKIYNNLGKIVYKCYDNSGEIIIDLNNYEVGFYYYKIIETRYSKISLGKFVKY